MRRAFIALIAIAILASACGDDDGGIQEADSAGSSDTVAASGSGSATAVVGGDTYEFSTVTCTLAGATLLSFSEGANSGSVSVADPVILVRLAVEGQEWVDDGAAQEPDRSGDTFSWSGPMSELSTAEEAEVSITISC